MTSLGMVSVIGLVCTSAVLLTILAVALCKVAAPVDVAEDDGEYES